MAEVVKPEPRRTLSWNQNEMCRINGVFCVYQGTWGEEHCRIMIPGHCAATVPGGGRGYTREQLEAMGYIVVAPLYSRYQRIE